MKALAASSRELPAGIDRDVLGVAQADTRLGTRWRSCCAALFGIGAPPVGEVDEQTQFDTSIMPLLWPPY